MYLNLWAESCSVICWLFCVKTNKHNLSKVKPRCSTSQEAIQHFPRPFHNPFTHWSSPTDNYFLFLSANQFLALNNDHKLIETSPQIYLNGFPPSITSLRELLLSKAQVQLRKLIKPNSHAVLCWVNTRSNCHRLGSEHSLRVERSTEVKCGWLI